MEYVTSSADCRSRVFLPEDDVGEATGEDSEVDLLRRRGRGRGTGGRARSLVQEESEALSDVDGFLAHAPASGEGAPIYVDEDGYEPDARNFNKFGMYEPDPEHALAPDEAYLSTDPLLEEFEASIQAAAATVSDLATKHVFCFQVTAVCKRAAGAAHAISNVFFVLTYCVQAKLCEHAGLLLTRKCMSTAVRVSGVLGPGSRRGAELY